MNANNNLAWASSKPGVENSIRVSCLGNRDTIVWPSPATFQSAHQQEARSKSGAGSQIFVSQCGMLVSKWRLHCTSACSCRRIGKDSSVCFCSYVPLIGLPFIFLYPKTWGFKNAEFLPLLFPFHWPSWIVITLRLSQKAGWPMNLSYRISWIWKVKLQGFIYAWIKEIFFDFWKSLMLALGLFLPVLFVLCFVYLPNEWSLEEGQGLHYWAKSYLEHTSKTGCFW